MEDSIPIYLQGSAASLTVLSNVFMAVCVIRRPTQPVPRIALATSAAGSTIWIAYAVLYRQYFLLASSVANVCLQTTTFAFRTVSARKAEVSLDEIKLRGAGADKREFTDSTDSLPSIPPIPQIAAFADKTNL